MNFSLSSEAKKTGEKLSLQQEVINRLVSVSMWPEKALSGEWLDASILSVWLGDYATWICEKCTPEEFFGIYRGMKEHISSVLNQTPAVVTLRHGQLMQAVFADQFSGEDFQESTVTAACAIRDAVTEFDPHGMNDPAYSPSIGIARGDVLTGIITIDDNPEYSITGKAEGMSRLLAQESQRMKEQILLDDKAGGLLSSARPIDYYRTPEFNVVYTLYGLRSDTDEHDEEYDRTYSRGLDLMYHENNRAVAVQAFSRCLDIKPDDHIAQFMIDRCTQKTGEINIRGYRAPG